MLRIAWLLFFAWVIFEGDVCGAVKEARILETRPHISLPPVPKSLSQKGRDRSFNLIDVWEQRLKAQSRAPPAAVSSRPQTRTVVMVVPSKMKNLLPTGETNPLYSPQNAKMTENFILDYLSGHNINFADPTLSTQKGVTIKSMSGRYLFFKKNGQGNVTLNGVNVIRHQLLQDHTNLILIDDFLFDHYAQIQAASKALPGSPHGHGGYGTTQESELLPSIPRVLKSHRWRNEMSGWLDLWEARVSQRGRANPHLEVRDTTLKPKTIFAISSSAMAGLRPPFPSDLLYELRFEKVTGDLLLDSFSKDSVDTNDPALNSRAGVLLKTMTGKDLLFKKDPKTGQIKVNGVDIVSNHPVGDGTTLFFPRDFLFNYHSTLRETHRARGHGRKSTNDLQNVPRIPAVLKARDSFFDASGLVDVWENVLRRARSEPHLAREDATIKPKTIVAVAPSRISRLFPAGTANPLLSTTNERNSVRFILDHISEQSIDPADPAMTTGRGVVRKTLTGRDLVFKKDLKTGITTLNGIDIEKYRSLGDGTNVFLIRDLLFDHYNMIQGAFKEEDTLVVPYIPRQLKDSSSRLQQVSGLLKIWEEHLRRDKNEPHLHRRDSPSDLKTILAVNPSRMTKLVQQDTPHPLYTQEYTSLRGQFLLDHLSKDKIDFNDPRLSSSGGLTLRTLSGKNLVFKKDFRGKLNVNGIAIENHHSLVDGMNVVIVGDFLFDHNTKVQDAYRNLLRTSGPITGFQGVHDHTIHGTGTIPVVTEKEIVPIVPEAVNKAKSRIDLSGLLEVWTGLLSERERNEPHLSKDDPSSRPKTILAVEAPRVTNLLSQAVTNPLYASSYKHMRENFILDHLSTDSINLNDRKMSSPRGLTIKTMSDKDLVFKKDSNGKVRVNGISIEQHHSPGNKVNLFLLRDFLFDHYNLIKNAINVMNPVHSPLSPSVGYSIPRIPSTLQDFKLRPEVMGLLDVWEHRLMQHDRREGHRSHSQHTTEKPRTVLAVTSSKMRYLAPDSPNPLLTPGYESLVDKFLLDQMSRQVIDLNNPALKSTAGVVVKTMSGRDLIFKKDATTGKLTVNGVDIERHHLLEDGTLTLVLKDFLFDHFVQVQKSFRQLFRVSHGETRLEDHKNIQFPSQERSLPPIPAPLKSGQPKEDLSPLLQIWSNRLVQLRGNRPPSQPKVILAVSSSKMADLVPQDVQNPFYDPVYADMTDDFILDHLSLESLNLADSNDRLSSPTGILLRTMSGKDLIFRRIPLYGKLSVNGIDVEKHYNLPDATSVVILSSFLFDHYTEAQRAYKSSLTSSQKLSEGLLQAPSPGHPGVTLIPTIPTVLRRPQAASKLSHLLPLWEQRLRHTDPSGQHTHGGDNAYKPKTIFTVAGVKMANLIPHGATNPLFLRSNEHLANQFVLDHLSQSVVDLNNRQFNSPAGFTIKTLSGKDLNFKKNLRTGKITVNGIKIADHQTLTDKTTIIVLEDFLFDHYNEIQRALRTSYPTSIEGQGGPSVHGLNAIPQLPMSLVKNLDVRRNLGLYKLWENRRNQHGQFSTVNKQPRTILSVKLNKMEEVIPSRTPNTFYSSSSSAPILDGVILDHLSEDPFDVNNIALTSFAGVTLQTMSEKTLNFKKDSRTGKTTVNGIPVTDHYTLADQTTVLVLEDFLFGRYTDLQRVIQTVPHGGQDYPGVNTIPQIPTELVNNRDAKRDMGIYNLWERRYLHRDRSTGGSSTANLRPKTILSVKPTKMAEVIPTTTPDAFYSFPSTAPILDKIILDHVSEDSFDANNRALASAQGVTLRTMSEKSLNFKKDFRTGKLTVNGIRIASQHSLPGRASLLILDDFLFNHRNDIQRTYQSFQTPSEAITLHKPSVIPQVPFSLRNDALKYELSSLLDVWEHRLRHEVKPLSPSHPIVVPKTILSVKSSKMEDLLRGSSLNPFYTREGEDLADRFIFDQLSESVVDLNSRFPSSGITITTLGGRKLRFKKEFRAGLEFLTVNGVPIEKHRRLSDGTNVIVLSDFLFDQYDKIQEEIRLRSQSGHNGHHQTHFKKSSSLPRVPQVLKGPYLKGEVSSLLSIWENRQLAQDRIGSQPLSKDLDPKTILAVHPWRMDILVPKDSPNPLYVQEYSEMTDEFLLDHLSEESIDFNDRRLSSSSGLILRAMSGKNLVFKKNSRGNLTINDVPVDKHRSLGYGTNLVIISDFLFDHKTRVQEGVRALLRTSSPPFDTHKTDTGSEFRFQTVPRVPTTFKVEAKRLGASEVAEVWENRRFWIDRESSPLHQDIKEPKTLVAISSSKMQRTLPHNYPNPLYTPGFFRITNQFLLDHLSSQELDFEDRRLTTPSGITLKAMSGKDLVFKKNSITGKMSVNGITIINVNRLPLDNLSIAVIDDFLFDNARNIDNALDSFCRSRRH